MPQPERSEEMEREKRKSEDSWMDPRSPEKYALWVAGAYFIVSFLWIAFSGNLAGLLAPDVASLTRIESVKGWFFVTITAVLLFIYIRKLLKNALRPQQGLDETVRRRTVELEDAAANLLVIMRQKDKLLEFSTRQQRSQAAVLKLSQDFFNVPVSEMSAALDRSLRVIGEYLDAERVTYAEYDDPQGGLSTVGQWAKAKPLSAEQVEELHGGLRRGNVRCTIRQGIEFYEPYPTLADEDEDLFEEKRYFRVNAPIQIQGKHRGSVMIATKKRVEEWTEEDVGILNIFVEMLRNAYVRRRQELELERRSNLMRVVLDSTPDGIYMLDAQGGLYNVNNGFAAFFNVGPEEVTGKKLSDFLPQVSFERVMDGVHRALATGQPATLLTEFRGIWLENFIYPVMAENGSYTMAAVFCANVTQRVQYEKELFVSRQMFKRVVENAPIAIFWRDIDGVYLGANKHMADAYGTTVENLIGEKAERFMERDEAQRQALLEEQMLKGGLNRIQVQQNVIRIDGEVRLFHVEKVPLTDENGIPYGILGVAEDITDRRRKELELVEAKRVAGEANAAKSMFLSRMSHEIRTPLNSIIGLTHIASQGGGDMGEYLARINASSRHLLEIVNDILDISRIEAGKLSINKAKFDLIGALESAVEILMPRADEKRQRVDLYIGGSVPRHVLGDQTRFKQVVVNLLSNAVKFTQEGGAIEVNVETLRETENGAVVRFSVRDNGMGVEPSQLERIFDPFEQGDASFSRTYEGTGLGLPICKSIVELMGGEIKAESTMGQGSEVAFTLPLETAREEEAAAAPSFDELSVLVVDDEPETRAYMNALLAQYGVKTTLAASGREAVDAACAAMESGCPFNVAFVDMRMPGMNGIEASREVRRICGEKMIVIMFSMYEWSDIEKPAREAGISMFLPKPIFPSKLLDLLYDITNGRRGTPPQRAVDPDCLRGKRILVAEDNAVNQLILREMLSKNGAILTPVYDGRQVVEAFKAAPNAFDAVLMDIQMPGMDGLEATRAIRAFEHERARIVPIIAMTANVFREDIEKAMLAGMDAHIGKPIDPDDLLGKLCKYIG
ncbi:MAG: response regulator [Clostridiaceae bacterium]